jgi:hypothetical protein
MGAAFTRSTKSLLKRAESRSSWTWTGGIVRVGLVVSVQERVSPSTQLPFSVIPAIPAIDVESSANQGTYGGGLHLGLRR